MRWLRHAFAPSAQRAFTSQSLSRITEAIREGERLHGGQVMFAIESDLPLAALWRGVSARDRAEHAFTLLKVWDTHANNGVLIYLLLADHAIEIVADRGLAGRVDAGQWQQICERLCVGLRSGDAADAVIAAVAEVSVLLARHFPATSGVGDENELPDNPQLLG